MFTNWIIFTDLDGTLLNAQTYSFAEALPAIQYLKLQGIPIIPCTSKTHKEVIALRKKLGINDPFIVENGSAVFIPRKYFQKAVSSKTMDDYEVIVAGKEHAQILECFHQVRKTFKLNIRGFTEMDVEEIARLTGLNLNDAAIAQKRFFSEPMVSDQDLTLNTELLNYLKEHGCRLLRGNRFYHLIGDTDKGKAAQIITELFQRHSGHKIRTMGLGDSKNDFDLLEMVDQPVLVRKHDGSYAQGLELNNVYLTEQIGPAGWNEAVERFIHT